MYASCIHGEIQENWITPWNGPGHHLKFYPKLKTKEKCWGWGESVIGGYQAKHSKEGYGCYADLSVHSFSSDKFPEI